MQTDCSPHATRRLMRRPALFAFALLAPLMSTGLACAQLPNPAAYLTFDEGMGTVAQDSSGHNENATLFGSAGWTTGLVGPSALSLPGIAGSYAEIPGDVLDTTEGNGSEVYASVTRDSRDGTIYLKVVNMAGEVQPVSVTINGIGDVGSAGEAIVLTSDSPQDTNTLSDPRKIVPVSIAAPGLGQSFEYRFKPYSVTVLQIGIGHKHNGGVE